MKSIKINENESTFAPIDYDHRSSTQAWNEDFPNSIAITKFVNCERCVLKIDSEELDGGYCPKCYANIDFTMDVSA
jgi:hypothetical protein